MENQKKTKKVPLKTNSVVGQDILDAAFKLNWNAVSEDELRDSQKRYDPYLEKEPLSLSLKLVKSDKSEFSEKPFYLLPPQTELQNEREEYIPGIDEVRQILFPKLSALRDAEQFSLFKCLRKKIVFKQVLDANEESEFQRLMIKAQDDFPVFQEFAQSMWRQYHYQRCYQVKPEIIHFTDSLWQKQSLYILSIYPPYFKLASNVPLNMNDPNHDHTVMELVKVVGTRGKPPLRMKKPMLMSRCELITDIPRLWKIKPILVSDSSEHVVKPIPPVSRDKNVDSFLLSDDFDVVLTPSAIKTILDNSNINNEWTLPFVIRNIIKSNGTSKKVLLIDKKLHAPSMSVLSKNKWHAKMTAKWALITTVEPHILGYNSQSEIKNEKNQEATDDISNNFQSVHIKDQQKKLVEASTKNHNQSTSKNERTLLCYDDSVDFDEIEEFGVDATANQKKFRQNQIVCQNKKAESCFEDKIPGGKSDKKKKAKISPRLEYKHWCLHKATHYKMSKHEQRPLNLLVRTRHDGLLFHTDWINGKREEFSDDVCISSKLEFQPEYGASVVEPSSSAREYIDLYLRPTFKLVRVRSLGHTQELMLLEMKTQKELQALMKDPKRMFDSLYAVLTSLVDLNPGQYMLRHTPRNGTFAQAFINNNDGTDLNLEQMYHNCTPMDVNAPPPQIDLSVFTSLHHYTQRPPGLLTPLSVQRKSVLGKPPETSITKRKKWKKVKKNLMKRMSKLQEN